MQAPCPCRHLPAVCAALRVPSPPLWRAIAPAPSSAHLPPVLRLPCFQPAIFPAPCAAHQLPVQRPLCSLRACVSPPRWPPPPSPFLCPWSSLRCHPSHRPLPQLPVSPWPPAHKPPVLSVGCRYPHGGFPDPPALPLAPPSTQAPAAVVDHVQARSWCAAPALPRSPPAPLLSFAGEPLRAVRFETLRLAAAPEHPVPPAAVSVSSLPPMTRCSLPTPAS